MNIYLIVEGEVGERILYKNWIPFVNNNLSYAATIDDVVSNNFFIQIGGGHPNYYQVIKDAITDVTTLKNDQNELLFDRLVIAIDSEDESYQTKYEEIENLIISSAGETTLDYKIVVQHFCLETWGLANKRIVSTNIQKPELLSYIRLFNVSEKDPELLPALPQEDLNRAQFATKYLRLLLNNKFRNLTYTKSDPGPLVNKKYFNELLTRHNSDSHISSFSAFLNAFI